MAWLVFLISRTCVSVSRMIYFFQCVFMDCFGVGRNMHGFFPFGVQGELLCHVPWWDRCAVHVRVTTRYEGIRQSCFGRGGRYRLSREPVHV